MAYYQMIINRKRFFASSVFLCFLMLLSITVKAWAPPGYLCCEINASHVPNGTYCVELLVQKTEIGDDWIPQKINIATTNMSISLYNYNGFVSYSYHCRNSGSDNILKSETDGFYSVRYGIDQRKGFSTKESMAPIKKIRTVQLAYVDKEGNILETTDSINIKYHSMIKGYLRVLRVDGNVIKAFYENGPIIWPIPLFFIVYLGLVGWIFRQRKKEN